MISITYRLVIGNLELGFYVETAGPLSESEEKKLRWLIAETFEPDKTGIKPHLAGASVIEIGPRLSIETPFSSNAVAICQAMGLQQVTRIECTRRYLIGNGHSAEVLLKNHLDRMTEQHSPSGIETFDTGV